MSSPSVFELHTFTNPSASPTEGSSLGDLFGGLPWDENSERPTSVLEFTENNSPQDSPVWIGFDRETKTPCRVDLQGDAVAGFAVIKRRVTNALSMITPSDHAGVLVNGLPALGFTVLSPRDSLVLLPGIHSYVTERIRPYTGKPPSEMLGTKCPFCKIPFTEDTEIVTCRCGVAYHHETEESHPAIDENDRLNCRSRLKVCLSCSRPVSLQEYMVWDPQTL